MVVGSNYHCCDCGNSDSTKEADEMCKECENGSNFTPIVPRNTCEPTDHEIDKVLRYIRNMCQSYGNECSSHCRFYSKSHSCCGFRANTPDEWTLVNDPVTENKIMM